MDRALPSPSSTGSKDGTGAGDHDQPYKFGRKPRAMAPWPFTERQFAHLLILRGRRRDEARIEDQVNAHPIVFLENAIWLASDNDLIELPPAA